MPVCSYAARMSQLIEALTQSNLHPSTTVPHPNGVVEWTYIVSCRRRILRHFADRLSPPADGLTPAARSSSPMPQRSCRCTLYPTAYTWIIGNGCLIEVQMLTATIQRRHRRHCSCEWRRSNPLPSSIGLADTAAQRQNGTWCQIDLRRLCRLLGNSSLVEEVRVLVIVLKGAPYNKNTKHQFRLQLSFLASETQSFRSLYPFLPVLPNLYPPNFRSFYNAYFSL